MADEWRRVTDDQICNYTGSPDNPETARYNRILQVRLTEGVVQLSEKLGGLMETIYRSSGRISEKTDELMEVVQKSTDRVAGKADEIRQSYERIADSQGRQQMAVIGLSIVVALATIAYAAITWKSVEVMRESNAIQRQMLAAQEQAARTPRQK